MKNEELQPSNELAKYFSTRREEAPMLSSLDLERLLARHEMQSNRPTVSHVGWNPISLLSNKKIIVSTGSALALGVATYLFFVSGIRNEVKNTALNQKPNHASYASSLPTPSGITPDQKFSFTNTGKHDRHSLNNVSNNPVHVTPSGEKINQAQLAAIVGIFRSDTNSNSDTDFCLSVSSYPIHSQPISLEISQNTRAQAYHPLLTSPETGLKKTHSSLLGSNDDLLLSLYTIGYKSLAHPVIAAYDTVKSVGERTIATLSTIVPHS